MIKRSIQLAGVFFLMSCQSEADTKGSQRMDSTSLVHEDPADKNADTAPSVVASSPFLDSVTGKKELAIGEIKTHTGIDSIYYTGFRTEAVFTGDTVLKLQNGLTAAIIKYDDRRNCIFRFLLIFDAIHHNTDNMIVTTDCDQDESSDYTALDYKFSGNVGFETTETFIPANNAPGTKKIVRQYAIDDAGKIKPVKAR